MNIKSAILTTILLSISLIASSQSLQPKEIIQKSINYHDPDGLLMKEELKFNFIETRPNGADRKSTISINVMNESFSMDQLRDEFKIHSTYNKGTVNISVDGKSDINDDLRKKYRLNEDRVSMMKNYYEYLWLMPVKLLDPGTIIDPNVKEVDFFGKQSLELRVTYEGTVGHDIWYFYFNPSTYALQGYRFYHDEEKNDGEYIILEDEAVKGSIRLPKSRTWYTHKEDKLLGTDILDSLEK